MCDIWIEKYKPKKIKDIIGNSNSILKINHWLSNFRNEKHSSLVISGYHGVGKNLITKILLENNNYYFKWLDYKDEKAKNLFDDLVNCFTGDTLEKFFSKENKKFALIINDIEKITLKNEKSRIKELVKQNYIRKYFPIIFISNMQHNKLLTDILDHSDSIKLSQPSDKDLLVLLNRIVCKGDIIISDEKIKKKLIKYAQNDMRRLISIVYDLSNSFENGKDIDKESLKLYYSNSQKKCKDTSLFEASKSLIDEYNDINNSLSLYKVDKVLVPLTIHENFTKSIFNRYKKNDIYFDTLKNVTDSISKGDVIETNIYTDQNWFLHEIHGFYTCAKTSYHINKHDLSKKPTPYYYEMKFSSDLNQTSLKNINKKQITNLQKIFQNKSFNDIINLNKLIYHLVKNEKIKELYSIMKDYDSNVKTVETIIKIDKTLPKISLNQKNKKIYNMYVKNKIVL
jgi:replication factor C large subunit